MSNQLIKYTADGRKVQLTSEVELLNGYAVKEVFITEEGEEVLGKTFVEKQLFDQKVISWKEKKLKELENKVRESDQRLNKQLKDNLRKSRESRNSTEAHLKALKTVRDNTKSEHFQLLIDFLAGNITHVIKTSYGNSFSILEFSLAAKYEQELKLVSLFGRSNGDLTYKIHSYPDASGGSGYEIYPCVGENQTHIKAQELIDSYDSITQKTIDCAAKYNLSISEDKLKTFYEVSRKAAENNLKDLRKRLARQEL